MGNHIEELAHQKKIKITSLSKASGINRSHIYSIIKGKSIPSLTTAKKIADVLGESIDAVFDI